MRGKRSLNYVETPSVSSGSFIESLVPDERGSSSRPAKGDGIPDTREIVVVPEAVSKEIDHRVKILSESDDFLNYGEKEPGNLEALKTLLEKYKGDERVDKLMMQIENTEIFRRNWSQLKKLFADVKEKFRYHEATGRAFPKKQIDSFITRMTELKDVLNSDRCAGLADRWVPGIFHENVLLGIRSYYGESPIESDNNFDNNKVNVLISELLLCEPAEEVSDSPIEGEEGVRKFFEKLKTLKTASVVKGELIIFERFYSGSTPEIQQRYAEFARRIPDLKELCEYLDIIDTWLDGTIINLRIAALENRQLHNEEKWELMHGVYSRSLDTREGLLDSNGMAGYRNNKNFWREYLSGEFIMKIENGNSEKIESFFHEVDPKYRDAHNGYGLRDSYRAP